MIDREGKNFNGDGTDMYNDGLVPVKKYRIAQNGLRGRAVSLPKVWLDELGLKAGDVLVMFRRANSNDLIVRPERKSA
jgi:hypothetical protein